MRFFLSGFLFIVLWGQAGEASAQTPQDTTKEESYWSYSNLFNLYLTQAAYSSYWKGSGYNNVTVSGDFDWKAMYKKDKSNFMYNFNAQYGMMKKSGQKWINSRDKLEMTGNYGFQFTHNMFLSALGNMRTFLTDVYKINDQGERDILNGKFFSPITFDIGSGLNVKTLEPREGEEKKNNNTLDFYYTPINSKITIAPDSLLAAQYLPEKNRAKGYRFELGSLVKVVMSLQLMENVIFESKADFFTNHLSSFGNFDINWESKLRMKVNKNITVAILGNLIYDDDIKFDILNEDGDPTGDKGPRTQFSESINLGLTHSF